MSVMIVDDHEANRYLLRALLQGSGYTVVEVKNGREALALARRNPPELIVSDLMMPVMDGYELLRQCKADESLKSIPFLVYTATYTGAEDEQLALALGAAAFIIKPVDPELFMARFRAVLAAAEHGDLTSSTPLKEEPVLIRAYNDVLFHKLEKKAEQLERRNRELEEEVAQRTQAEAALRASEERFRELAETIQEVFWVRDCSQNRMLYVSPACERIVGRSSATFNESPYIWVDAIHSEDRDRILHAAETRQTTGDYDETYRVQRPDGSIRWIHERAFPVRDAAGKVVRVVGTAEDVTDQRQLEEQFRQSQKMEAIGQLAAGVAHDFGNIIATILGNTSLALAEIGDDNPARFSLDQIGKAGDRAKSLVEQILVFSRRQPPERRVIDLGSIVQESVDLLRAIIPPAVGFDISMDAGAHGAHILADATQMHQVVTNLCTNAWHAFGDKPGRIAIQLQVVTLDDKAASRLTGINAGQAVCLSVTDSGKGMDAPTLDRIFDPFFTTKTPGKGTGLGLSIVLDIVREHGGAIAVTSQPGAGTTFNVYFPAAPAVDSAAPVESPILRGNGQHILYLDDEESLVLLVTCMLEKLGYRVTAFTSAVDATNAFRENPLQFDLAITDLNMPGPSGLNVAADLLKVRPDLPIVLCSGNVSDELVQKARDVGILEVLYKPSSMQEFGEAIHRLASKNRPVGGASSFAANPFLKDCPG